MTKMVRKFTKVALLSSIMVGSLVGSAFAEVKWDMPTPYGDKTFHTVNIHQFAEDVKAATNGELVINVHSANSLIKHAEIKKAIRSGIVPIGEFFLSRLANEDAVFGVDSVPFVATSYDDAAKLWGASKDIINSKLEAQGLQVLFSVPWPSQGFYAKKEVSSVADMKGLKFRAYNTATERLAQLAGMEPTQIESADISTAFSTGRVDAMITSPSTGANSKAWDFLSHFHNTQAWLPKNIVLVNKKAFMKLDEATQKAVLEAGAAAETRGWKMSMAESDEKIGVMKDNGIAIITPSEKLTSELKAIGATMSAEWLESAGDDGRAIMDAYNK